MNKSDPTVSHLEARERRAVAELLGRILAAYWLDNRRSTDGPTTAPASPETPLTTPTIETYDGR